MRIFVSLCAACLMAGAAWAQQDNPQNPHSTANKDRTTEKAPQSTTNRQIEATEPGNPTHTHAMENDAARSGTNADMDDAESENPHSTTYKDRMAAATPQMILHKLHATNQHEIEAGKLAEQNGTDKVKDYARALQKDHQDADAKVMALAQKKGFKFADQPMKPEMQQKHQNEKDRLSSLKGAEFDRTFANMMYKGHDRVIQMAQMWKQNCKDQDVCALIDELMPALQKHRQMAEQLRGPMPQGRTPERQ